MFGNLKPMINMDTHNAFKKLVHAGLQEKVAESIVEIIDENQKNHFENLVTKDYLDSVNLVTKTELKKEISDVRTELKEDIAQVRTELKEDIAQVRTELREFKVEVAGNFNLLKWMFGISTSLSLAIIAKLFLV